MGTTEIELKGGPHGRNTELLIGGQKMFGVHRVELVADVTDVIRVTTFQFAETIVKVEGLVVPVYDVRVNIREEEEWKTIASTRADTIWQGLYDCARQLELAARKEAERPEV